MNSLVNKIKHNSEAIMGNGSSEEDILIAEEILCLKFSDEYRSYLLYCTVAMVDGIELTGLSRVDRVNVVNVTTHQRKLNDEIPEGFYVVEEANIDGIVIWQNQAGEIYLTAPGVDIKKIANTLEQYLFGE